MNGNIEINVERILKRIERPLKEGLSETGFLIGLYLEHLEEASFLYEQRISLLDDPQISWRDLEYFEGRFEAHIDALVVGEELALCTCIQQAIEGDFGEMHAAVRVLCRWNNFTLFKYIIEKGDLKDKKRVKAIGDALCHEMPVEWVDDFNLLSKNSKSPALESILAHVLGYLRIKRTDIIYSLLNESIDADVISKCAWTLGRIGSLKDHDHLSFLFTQHSDSQIREQVGLALLRLKDESIVYKLKDIKEPWAYILIGISGLPQAQKTLIANAINTKIQCPENVLGIGLSGAVQGIDILLSALENKKLSESASQALFLITGVELYEESKLEEEVDTSENDIYSDDNLPSPITITQLSRNTEKWKEYLEKNLKHLPQNGCVCFGAKRTEDKIASVLRSECVPKNLRRYLCELLAVMSQQENVLEFDCPVGRQKMLLGLTN